MQSLIQYVFVAILAWVPVRNLTPYGESESDARARLHAVAEDIVTVAMDAAEPATFTGTDGRIKTALLQASIASLEAGFQKFVEDGTCNTPGYVPDRRGNCDGGHAFSLWQIHVFGGGYLLLEDGLLQTTQFARGYASAHPDEVVRGQNLIADRKIAARVAQRLERSSLKNYHSLCAFTGEPCGDGEHPKALARFDRAKDYFAKHPYVPAADTSGPTASNP